jgi:phospholipid/cholesterol/gamma-HCH transport system substrate-binding protein
VKENLAGAVWRLAIFVAICLLAIFGSLMVFAQLRFQKEQVYKAEFTTVSGLEEGNFVRIAGVEVGKVKSISITPDAVAMVEFSTEDTVVLTEGTRALIRYDNLIGGRYLELQEGAGEIKRLEPGQTIPLGRTEPALDLDALIGGFRPLFRALDPEKVNALSGQLIQAFQGQGATISSFLAQTAAFTNTLADRDELIGQVIVNLNGVLGSLGDQSDQVKRAVGSLSELVEGLEARKSEFADGLARIGVSTGILANLVEEVRPPLPKVVHETDRTAGIVVADHDYVDNLLNTLPDAYQALARQGMYGDYFSFYLCDAVLKLNGKGGQPVYVKVAGQSTGRCAPK